MGIDPVKLTRRQLYEVVWSEPVSKLARKYGLSDVGLAKICKKHNIPRPGLGYWAQKQYGKAVPPTPLPNPENNPVVTINPHSPQPADPDRTPGTFTNIFSRALDFEAGMPKIEVTPVRGVHDLVETSMALIRHAKQDDWGRFVPEYEETLNIFVGKKARVRAHRIMDTLIKQLEARGCLVQVDGAENRKTRVKLCGEYVGLRIVEMLKVVSKPSRISDTEKPRSGFHEYPPATQWRWDQTITLSGRLSLGISSGCYTGDVRLRHYWRDGDRQKLEDCLNDVVVGMIRTAAAQRAQKAKWARRDATYAAEKVAGDMAARRKAQADRRDGRLQEQVENWKQAQDVRAFVAAATQKASDTYGAGNIPKKLKSWIAWAAVTADQDDPLSAQNLPKLSPAEAVDAAECHLRVAVPEDQILQHIERTATLTDSDRRTIVRLWESDSYDPELFLVADVGDALVGHALFVNVGVKNFPGMCGVVLAYAGVLPEYEKTTGRNSILEAGIKSCREHGKDFILVRGQPSSYAPFGFSPVTDSDNTQKHGQDPLLMLALTPGTRSMTGDHFALPESLLLSD